MTTNIIKLQYTNGLFINSEQYSALIDNKYEYYSGLYIKTLSDINVNNRLGKYYYSICSVYNPKDQYLSVVIYKKERNTNAYIKQLNNPEKVISNRNKYCQQNSKLFSDALEYNKNICNTLREYLLNKSELDTVKKYINPKYNLNTYYLIAKIDGNERVIHLINDKYKSDKCIAHSRLTTCKYTALLNNRIYRLNHIGGLMQ